MIVSCVALVAFVVLFLAWRVWFLRDPLRVVPPGDGILAAADGFITYVKRVERGEVPIAMKGRTSIALPEIAGVSDVEGVSGWLVGTFMTAFSVHRNRAPVSGEVVLRRHQPAPRNLSMARIFTRLLLGHPSVEDDCAFLVRNERLTLGIRGERGMLFVTQIADAWINRIVARIDVGARVERGEQYGLIRFGSQVDVFIPDTWAARVVVKPGEYVRAGETVLAVPHRAHHVRRAESRDNERLLELLNANPIEMELSYVYDRRPDFFSVVDRAPGSTSLMVEREGRRRPLGCISLLRFEGRIGDRIRPYHYATDLHRDPADPDPFALRDLLRAGARAHLDAGVSALVGLQNMANRRAITVARFVNRFLPFPYEQAGTFDYTEIVPLERYRIASRYRVGHPGDEKELSAAIEFINRFYERHTLYSPLIVLEPASVVTLHEGRELVGAMSVEWVPSATVRVVRMDASIRWFNRALALYHGLRRRAYVPLRVGGAVRTIQIRHLAARDAVALSLLGHLNNVTLERGMHTLSFLIDERETVRSPSPIVLRYKTRLVVGLRAEFGMTPQAFGSAPLFFDVSCA